MPELASKAGHDVITASGDTLLGADDKAGVAAIMAAVAHLRAHPELPRPGLAIAFTPDEEIGHGASLLDLERFGASCAYTIDGSEIGELQDETALEGSAARARLTLIVRDFDDALLADHVALLEAVAHEVVDAEPRATLDIQVNQQYRNMRVYLEASPRVIEAAAQAIRAEGIEPRREPIRGGTDGSQLSARGLPTPNIFDGGHEYHSVREWASLQEMAAAAATLVRLCEIWATP
jgi:tripeptide aminopeptidase